MGIRPHTQTGKERFSCLRLDAMAPYESVINPRAALHACIGFSLSALSSSTSFAHFIGVEFINSSNPKCLHKVRQSQGNVLFSPALPFVCRIKFWALNVLGTILKSHLMLESQGKPRSRLGPIKTILGTSHIASNSTNLRAPSLLFSRQETSACTR